MDENSRSYHGMKIVRTAQVSAAILQMLLFMVWSNYGCSSIFTSLYVYWLQIHANQVSSQTGKNLSSYHYLKSKHWNQIFKKFKIRPKFKILKNLINSIKILNFFKNLISQGRCWWFSARCCRLQMTHEFVVFWKFSL